MTNIWQLQEAKNKLSEVIARAEQGDVQVVTKHGVATAVVMSYAEYQRLTAPTLSLLEFFQNCPLEEGEELDITRDNSPLREDIVW